MVAIEARQLVTMALDGDEAAFSELVRSVSDTLYAAAYAILRNEADAQDCVQDAVLRGWDKIDTLKQREYFKTWMTRITVTTAINMTHKNKRNVPLVGELPAKGSRADERLDIRRAIESLDQKTRVCTVLYYFEDMTIEEIAQSVGILRGTVKSRLFRAREKLRGILEGYDHEKA